MVDMLQPFMRYHYARIPKVYYDKNFTDLSKYVKIENALNKNLIIFGGSNTQRTLFLVTLLKKFAEKGAKYTRYYNFSSIIEHFREKEYLELLRKTVDLKFRWVGIDRISLAYFDENFEKVKGNYYYKKFFSFLMEIYETPNPEGTNMYLSVSTNKDDFYELMPNSFSEVVKEYFLEINLEN